tara:strand:- start:473 stop:709 length:237 start_codon:yes stop_codon:yes gene_type:complete
MKQITIRYRIRQDGLVEELVEGVLGEQCEQLTRTMEDNLGEVSYRRLTQEYYQQPEFKPAKIIIEDNINPPQPNCSEK